MSRCAAPFSEKSMDAQGAARACVRVCSTLEWISVPCSVAPFAHCFRSHTPRPSRPPRPPPPPADAGPVFSQPRVCGDVHDSWLRLPGPHHRDILARRLPEHRLHHRRGKPGLAPARRACREAGGAGPQRRADLTALSLARTPAGPDFGPVCHGAGALAAASRPTQTDHSSRREST